MRTKLLNFSIRLQFWMGETSFSSNRISNKAILVCFCFDISKNLKIKKIILLKTPNLRENIKTNTIHPISIHGKKFLHENTEMQAKTC